MTRPFPKQTVAQAAAAFGVSERTIRMAREVQRSRRADLIAAMEAGEMTVHAAWRHLRGPDHLGALRRAWARTPQEDQRRFIAEVAAGLSRTE